MTHTFRITKYLGDGPDAEGNIVPLCHWFALCPNVATGVERHPILGFVPICERCADKLDRMDAMDADR
jgi:hypothetical protein